MGIDKNADSGSIASYTFFLHEYYADDDDDYDDLVFYIAFNSTCI